MGTKRLDRRNFVQQMAGGAALAWAGSTSAQSVVAITQTRPLNPGPISPNLIVASEPEVPAWKAMLSKPDHEVRTLIDVKAEMRDGVKLSANVFLPKKNGRWPVILERSPYGPKGSEWYVNRAIYYAQRGYVYVLQDVRGRYDSEGKFHPWDQEINDGRDSLDWCGTQAWSDGNVGMMGMSYMGLVQWLAAPTGSPYLKAIIPHACAADYYMYGMNYTGGAFMHYINLPWAIGQNARTLQSRLPYDWEKIERLLPTLTADEIATGRAIDFYREWVLHSTYDGYWKKVSNFGKYHKMDLPILQICGWLDPHAKSLIANYEGIQREGTPLAIRQQKVILGPWIHTDKPVQKYGDLDFGPDSVIDMYEIFLRWMDRWLKGIENDIEHEPPLKLFTMGANRWRMAEKWPLPEAVWTKFYLRSVGRANSLYGNGKLSRTPPLGDEPADHFVYDPEDPVPTLGSDPNGQILPLDSRPIERRDDVLVYSSDALNEDLEVTGPVQAHLYASSSATDTDWTVKLLDVHTQGQAINLYEGIIRGRFRDPGAIRTGVPAPGQYENPKLLEPGKVYEFTVEVGVTSVVFQKGHQIRIEVSSSNFPHFDRNLNNGGQLGVDARIVVAKQTIYHTRQYPSNLELPVIPAGRAQVGADDVVSAESSAPHPSRVCAENS
jgi:putative CocE/NonD family hydrolase